MSQQQELWKPIPGWPDYEVSNQGRIVSFKGPEPRILRCSTDKDGYRRMYFPSGPTRSLTVHSLVAEVFLGPRPVGLEIRHLDGDPLNCAVSNLEYGTRAQNMQDRLAHGRNPMTNKTQCKWGHPYDADNTYTSPQGKRSCRTCKRLRDQSYALRAANVRQARAA